METYVVGSLIKKIREEKCITQSILAEKLSVSEKTISKWETGRGLPDISLIEPLAQALGVSVVELFSGEKIINTNKHSNMLNSKFYVCPICGNVVTSVGELSATCCGSKLLSWEVEESNTATINIDQNDVYVTIDSKMTKTDYVTFIAYVTCDRIDIVKLYPEQSAEATFLRRGHGYIYYFESKNGLFRRKL